MDCLAPLISVVVPNYKCRECLPALFERLKNTMEAAQLSFELIIVNDASPDDSWPVIQQLSRSDSRVKGLNLSRNFGQHFAITAGLDYTQGDWVVVMDCDLQDQPEEIPKLYQKAAKGYEVVLARRHDRQDSYFKRFSSFCFYKVLDYFSEMESDPSVANFGIYSRKVIDGVRSLREQSRFFPLMVRWLGFEVAYVDVEHAARTEGKSTYNLKRLVRLASDSIVAQTNKPLRLSIKVGFLISFLAFLYGVHILFLYFIWGTPVEGWASVIVSIYFMSGIILASTGMLGVYIGKIYDEAKNRPLYILKDQTGI
jgi:glycosyltransferase involved in cell wall biosynthesis